MDNPDYVNRLNRDFENPILVSALTGKGMSLLIDEISNLLSGLVTEIKVEIPNNRMDMVNLIYEKGKVNYREDKPESVYLEAIIPVRLKSFLSPS